MTPILEIRFRRESSLGVFRQSWPQTHHTILRVGRVESRLILPKGQSLSVGLVLVAFVGLFLR